MFFMLAVSLLLSCYHCQNCVKVVLKQWSVVNYVKTICRGKGSQFLKFDDFVLMTIILIVNH